jgi:hypothetical protein
MENPFENFGMIMPTGAYKHPDGTTVIGMSPEEKAEFVKYCAKNNVTDENTTWKQREEIFKIWKK